MVTIDAVVLGGGLGRRFSDSAPELESALPKQFHLLGEAPVFVHAIRRLFALGCLRQVILTMPSPYIPLANEHLAKHFDLTKYPIRVIAGGNSRQESSRLALEALEESGAAPTRVLIHDACRPFLSNELLQEIKRRLFDRSYGAWVPVVPVVETIKKVDNHQVIETVDRSSLHRVQTPQVFEFSVIKAMMDKVRQSPDLNFTDDASLCEYYGIPVGVFEGDVRNLKLTYVFEKAALSTVLATEGIIACDPESATTFTV